MNTSVQRLLIAFLIFAAPFASYSQNATIRGFVYEQETGEPAIFTNIKLKGTSMGAASDVNGLFVISQVPPGSYTLVITYLGFDTLSVPVTVKAGQIFSQKYYLKKSAITIEGVEISAEREEARTETKVSDIKITPKQIKQLPTIGGQPDLAQYLQVVPGVVFTGDQGGQLYIRGGSPIQNKVILDGMVVYNPFHSIGLFSVFETDIIRNVDVYTGGYGAEYGGRISSVMDITTRDGNKKRFSGKFGASPFGANLIFEGPIAKAKDESGSSSSFIFSAKNSYLGESSKIFYHYIDTTGLPFNFQDIYGKISFTSNNGSKANIFGFNFSDNVIYKNTFNFDWNASGGGANFVVIPSGSSTVIDGNFAYSDYKISLTNKGEKPRTSEINGFNLGLNFTYYIGKNQAKYGIEMLGFKTLFDFYNSVGRYIDQTENTTEIAAYFKYKATKGKFLIEPSFRVHFYATTFSPEPRLAMKYNASKHFRLKFAGGLYSQNLIAANSDRDVVNLFYGFLSGPDNLQEKFNGKDVTHNLQKATHVVFGFEYDFLRHFTVNVEGYYKYFPQLTNINRNKVYDDNADYWDKPDYLKKDFVIETGDAEGVDVALKYDYKRYYLWAVYSFGFIHRFDGVSHYVPHYDRRHNVNLVGSYQFGKGLLWELSARWNMGSGFPFTQTQGFYPKLTFIDGINSDIKTAAEELGIMYGEINLGRLPYYHRLDINLKKRFELGENTTLEANVSITNVYNRKNIFYFDIVRFKRVDQLPIMPSAGVTLKF